MHKKGLVGRSYLSKCILTSLTIPRISTKFDTHWEKGGRATQRCVNSPVTAVLTIHRPIQPPIEPTVGKGEQILSKSLGATSKF